ncbi:unnamed protein product [marine sediment metagenome]|uniref:Uncharacterized protein n=1 Tax=marine sediment metagenome TaxID=412755 RepID=X1U5P5_9ZZZZ
MTNLVPPHNGKLSPRLVIGEERDEALSEARSLPLELVTSAHFYIQFTTILNFGG